MIGHTPELWKRDKPELQTDFLIREKILVWIGDVKGKKILDAGCGEGYLTRKFISSGACVNAFDIDKKMIETARNADPKNEGIYQVSDLLEIDKNYSVGSYDIVILSGVICFLDKDQLVQSIENIYKILKSGGKLFIQTNHTDSFFKKAKSGWLEYLSDPDTNPEKALLNFNNSKGEVLFHGEVYLHSPKRIKQALIKSGFKILKSYEPLATKNDMKNFPEMWGDEHRVPFHLVLVAEKLK